MRITATVAVLSALLLGSGGVAAQQGGQPAPLEARVWLDRGDQPVLQRGDRVRVYYRASADAYVAIFRIDTDGRVSLLHPRSPQVDHYIRGGRDYRLLFPRSPYWYVDEYPGMGYFFVVASPEAFDFSSFGYVRQAGWDLSGVGEAVYEDPYLAMDDFVARLIPGWETAPYALDFISYDVGEAHDYPRFLCYDCHGYKRYVDWNPYTFACSTFRVVIWDDPYYYPATRYRGTRVVFATPRRNRPRFEFKERAAGEGWSPLVRRRSAPRRSAAEYREPAVAPRPGMGGTIQRRPSAPVRTPDARVEDAASPSRAVDAPRRGDAAGTASGGAAARPRSGGRPVLSRRPPSSSAGSPGAAGTRPGAAVRRPSRPPVDVRVVRPPTSRRPTAGSRPTVPVRPSVRPRSSSGSRPPVVKRAPPQRRPVVKPKRKPGGGGQARRPPPRKKRGAGGGF